MKKVIVIFICTLLTSLFLKSQSEKCEPVPGSGETKSLESGAKVYYNCTQYDCKSDGSWIALECPVSVCKIQVGYIDYDYSKPYPECCPYPICG